jgi:hypothetical protein
VELGPAEVIRRIVTFHAEPPLSILAVGSTRGEAQKASIIAAGARAFFIKPLGVEKIVEYLQVVEPVPAGNGAGKRKKR